ncbi:MULTISPECIES: TetR/AcrR family transcriptional regulator [Amycolatopsis]|uniref:TetR/AcrR family transcriptional regulator n=1 Tax=Amycolatopsis albidoflavus TaxID=102226 RepID=A0ABW5HT02_9PSEU
MDPKERRAARHQSPNSGTSPKPRRRTVPITVEQVVDTALEIISAEGFEALSMRRVADALNTGPASLYAHVVNKTDLDELLIARLSSKIVLPKPDAANWREQIRDVCAQVRDLYLAYPGISGAAFAVAPTDLDTARLNEGMLAILLNGGVTAQAAAWGVDALLLYVAAYCLETSIVRRRVEEKDAVWVVGRDEMQRRLASLPAEEFPYTASHAVELTAGEGHDRFDFAVSLMIDGLTRR